MNIYELLNTGKQHAIPGGYLAKLLNCNIRDITKKVECERRAGVPICANSDGYYLAADRAELLEYCQSVRKRSSELQSTRRALLKAVGKLPGTHQD